MLVSRLFVEIRVRIDARMLSIQCNIDGGLIDFGVIDDIVCMMKIISLILYQCVGSSMEGDRYRSSVIGGSINLSGDRDQLAVSLAWRQWFSLRLPVTWSWSDNQW